MQGDSVQDTCNISQRRKGPDHLWKDFLIFTREIERRLQKNDRLEKFEDDLAARLEKGYEDYGDKSFEMSPLEIIKELNLEFVDIPGWSFILWKRLHKNGGLIPRWMEDEFFDIIKDSIELWARMQDFKTHLTG